MEEDNMQEGGSEKEKKAESAQDVKRPVFRWGVLENGNLIVEVHLSNPHIAMGVLDEAHDYVLTMMKVAKLEQREIEEKKKAIIECKDPMAREAMKNPAFFKKKFIR